MSGAEIRACTLDDLDEIVPLLEQLWPGMEIDRSALVPVFRKGLDSQIQCYLCAEDKGRVVAFCALTLRNSIKRAGPLAFIDELVVDEAARGQGLGDRMLERALEWARENNASVLELESGRQRKRAHKFYLDRGFEHTAVYLSRPVAP